MKLLEEVSNVENEGKQRMPPQNVTLWHQDYLGLVILRTRRHRRNSENSRGYSLVRKFKKEISICKSISLFVPGRVDD